MEGKLHRDREEQEGRVEREHHFYGPVIVIILHSGPVLDRHSRAYDVEGAYERWLQNILNIR